MSMKKLTNLLIMIDTEQAQLMLKDLRDEEKRTPQLYNAIGKMLERHKFKINAIEPDVEILGDLAVALEDYDKLGENEIYQ